MQTDAIVVGVQARHAVPVVWEDWGTKGTEPVQVYDNGRHDHVPRGRQGHPGLEPLEPDQRWSLHAPEAGDRGTQVTGCAPQETTAATVQHGVRWHKV